MRNQLEVVEKIMLAKGYLVPTAVFTATRDKEEWSIYGYANSISVENAVSFVAPSYDDLFVILVRNAPAI